MTKTSVGIACRGLCGTFVAVVVTRKVVHSPSKFVVALTRKFVCCLPKLVIDNLAGDLVLDRVGRVANARLDVWQEFVVEIPQLSLGNDCIEVYVCQKSSRKRDARYP